MCKCSNNCYCIECAATAYWHWNRTAYCVQEKKCCGCSQCVYFTKPYICGCGSIDNCADCGRPDHKYNVHPHFNPERWNRVLAEGAEYHARIRRNIEAEAKANANILGELIKESPRVMSHLLGVVLTTTNKQTAKKTVLEMEKVYKTFLDALYRVPNNDAANAVYYELLENLNNARQIYVKRRWELRRWRVWNAMTSLLVSV